MGRLRSPDPGISIVIPAVDAAMNVYFVLRQLPEAHEIVLVDCGSSDGTQDVARHARPDVRVLDRPGVDRGAALAAGIAAATGEIIVTMPVDGSVDPGEVPTIIEALLAGADLAKGSRYVEGGSALAPAPGETFGDRMLARFGRLAGADVTDLGYGFYGFWADQRDRLRLPADRAADASWTGNPDVTVAVRLAEAGATIVEVPTIEKAPLVGTAAARGPAAVVRGMRAVLAERRRSRRGQRRSAATELPPLPGTERSLV